MPKAQVIRELGPPDIMKWEEWPVPDPQPDEVRVRHTAIGVNFADTYHRSGRHHPWPAPPFPCVLGIEAVGIVEGLGSDVANFEIGQRVCYSRRPLGSYSEVRNYPAENLLHLPEDMRDLDVASSLLKGLTAQYLLTRTYSVQSGDTIVVHAAAGGTGQILCQWAAALGATIIGTVSTPAKAEAARAAGCHIPVVRSEQDFVEIVQDATDGEGAAVVYDSVGKDTFQDSLRCLRTFGYSTESCHLFHSESCHPFHGKVAISSRAPSHRSEATQRSSGCRTQILSPGRGCVTNLTPRTPVFPVSGDHRRHRLWLFKVIY